ncbi:CoA pyrophosphatase [Yoonia sp. R2331]|uniref:CoA pyrophosphatase n=1 Tax=Yoonia sp. R2331 TaxID=3237238 RepID=UPI0034E55C8C
MTGPDLEGRLKGALSAPGRASSDYDLNSDIALPAARKLTPASVLIGVRAVSGQVVLTKRSARLKHHPGQIAFAGGRQDPEDSDATAAALREAREEIGLNPDQVRVLGTLPPHETVTRYQVTPVVALIEGDFDPIPEEGEVSEVFEVPIAHVTDPLNYLIQSRHWQGRARYYYTVPFGPYYIWGATARILRSLADRMS